MGLLAEGHKKWATILQLVQNGILTENSLLFWDEPESNINPSLIEPTVDLLITLAQLGVQIFISTHSYFLLQELELYCKSKNKKNKMIVNFFSLYQEGENTLCEEAELPSSLDNNAIYDEFINLYKKEEEQFYEH